ncbi:N-acetylglucosaminyl-phosphatidylinositol de-N-acetylase isoform X2 [Arapaima gigas]
MFVAVLFVFTLTLYFIWTKNVFSQCQKKSDSAHLITLIKQESKNVSEPLDGIRALLVIAHPDDECMFFGPAVLKLRQLGAQIHVLCLSTGNYYHEGQWRQKELTGSCGVLGIPASQVTIVDNKDLPDDPAVTWSPHLVSSLILKHIKESLANLVLSFDGTGVSGHANHIAIYRGLRYIASCCFLALQSVNIIRKYLSVLELPVSWMCTFDFCCITGLKEYRQAKKAMFCHHSQLLWYRYIYLLVSRYMFINTFQVITQEEGNFKIH